MGNEQSTETLPTDQPSTQSPSPSVPPSPSHPSSSPMSPQPPTSPSNPKSSQRRSTRQKRRRFCPCEPSHATKQAYESDPNSTRYMGDLYSTFLEDSDEDSDDDESALNVKSGDESLSPSDSNSKGKEVKMPSKRAATGGNGGRPKKSKVEEKEEQSCDCAEKRGSLIECERENLRREESVRMEAVLNSKGTVVVHVGGEGRSEKQSFVVHRELLMMHSSFFRSLLIEKAKIEVENEVKDEAKKDGDAEIKNVEFERPALAVKEAQCSDVNNTQIDRDSFFEIETFDSLEDFEDLDAPMTTLTGQQKPVNLPDTQGTPTSKSAPSNLTPTLTTLSIPTLSPTICSIFIAYIYTGTVPSQPSNSTNTFATLYLFAARLCSPRLMNHLLTTHRRNLGSWPSPEQVHFIYSSLATYTPLNLPSSLLRGKEAITKIGEEGKRILRRFTAACIAAKNPFAKIKEGEKWSKLLAKCEGLGLDVLMRWGGGLRGGLGRRSLGGVGCLGDVMKMEGWLRIWGWKGVGVGVYGCSEQQISGGKRTYWHGKETDGAY